MFLAWLPLIICVLGLVGYAITTNARVQELSRLAFACGLLVVLLDLGRAAVR